MNIDNLKEKIKEQVEEIELELENSKYQIDSIEELSPKTLAESINNDSVYCRARARVKARGSLCKWSCKRVTSNFACFFAIGVGRKRAMALGRAEVMCGCFGDGVSRKEKEDENKNIHNSFKFNEEIEKTEELRELRETIKNKCETIKGYVDEIIKINKEDQLKNINDENIKVLRSNGSTVVCTGFGGAWGFGDDGSRTYSGVMNEDDIAISDSLSQAYGDHVAIVYGYAYLDCECEDCTNIPE